MNIHPTERRILAHLRERWAIYPVHIYPIETSTRRGFPDLWIWLRDVKVGLWMELKRGDSTLRSAQLRWVDDAIASDIPIAILRGYFGYRFKLWLQGHVTEHDNAYTLYHHITGELRHAHD